MLVGVCLIPAHVDGAVPLAQSVQQRQRESSQSLQMPFRDATLPASARAWDIIERLTVAEKAALLSNTAYTVERLGGTQFDGAVQSLQGNECLHGVGNVFSNASGRYFPDRRVTSFPQAPPPTPQPIRHSYRHPHRHPHHHPHTTTHTRSEHPAGDRPRCLVEHLVALGCGGRHLDRVGGAAQLAPKA